MKRNDAKKEEQKERIKECKKEKMGERDNVRNGRKTSKDRMMQEWKDRSKEW